MNEYQLACLRTGDLISLKNSINKELLKRKKSTGLESRFRFVDSLSPVQFKTKKEIEDHNSSSLLSIPGNRNRKHASISIYLPALIKQDWSHLYNGGDQQEKYYVYCHVNPRLSVFVSNKEAGGNYGGQPFYIGKGTGNRAFDLKRNQGHGHILNELLSEGIPPEKIVKIIFDNLTEAKAFEIEAKLIYFFGTIYKKSIKKMGILYNLDIPPIPKFVGEMIEY